MKKILIIIIFSFLLSNISIAQSDFSPAKIEEIKTTFHEYYDIYETKEYDRLHDYLTPELDQYISLKNTTTEAIIKNAEHFFKNKTNIVYQPYFDKMELSYNENGNIVAKFGILMIWEVTDSNIINYAEMNSRSVNVLCRVILTPDFKITSYYEDKVIRPKYELTKDLKAYLVTKEPQDEPEFVELGKGTIVTDDFTIKASDTTSSSWTYFARQVIYEDEKYLIDHYGYYEDNESYDYYLQLVDHGFAEEDKKYFDLTKNPTDWQLAFSNEKEDVIANLSNPVNEPGLKLSDYKNQIIIYTILVAVILFIIILTVYWLLKKNKEKEMFDL